MKSLKRLLVLLRFLLAIPVFGFALWLGIENWHNLYLMLFTKTEYGAIIPFGPAIAMFLAAFICHNKFVYRILPLLFWFDIAIFLVALFKLLKQAFKYVKELVWQ